MPSYLYDLFRQRSPAADKVFLEALDGRTITYAGLHEGSGKLAQTLTALGVVPGDRVAVQVEKSPDAVVMLPIAVETFPDASVLAPIAVEASFDATVNAPIEVEALPVDP